MGARRILVVDDEETIGRVLRRVLFGYEVSFVTSGRDGLARLERGEQFDAVICDVHMPGMGGLEFASRLESVAPELVPHLLFLTGDHDAATMLAGRHVLTIPFETHALRSFVERIVQPDRPALSVSKRPTAPPPNK